MSPTYQADIAVIGGGAFGTALAVIIGQRKWRVKLWVRREDQAEEINREHTNQKYLADKKLSESIKATSVMADAVRAAPVVLMVVPSRSFREVARSVGETLMGDQLLVHATKGIEVDSFLRMSQILREETCALKIGALSGPNLAGELMAGYPTGSVIASRYDEVVEAMQRLFRGSYMRLYGGRDVVGTEIGGSFKNIVAIASGVTDGLKLGDNTKSLLITRGLSEMAIFGTRVGADVFTFGGLAGVGDLMATCGSRLSRNHQAGEKFAEGMSVDEVIGSLRGVAEGVPTSKAVYERAKNAGLDLPLVNAVYRLVHEGHKATDLLGELMALPVTDEFSALRYQ